MSQEAPWAAQPTPNFDRRKERRRKIAFAALAAWALVATGIAGWLLLQPKGPSQSQVWALDSRTLGRLEKDFGFMALDTQEYLSTNDTDWTWNAVNWAYLSYSTVYDVVAAPGGFPSGQPLGFNATGMCVASYGYDFVNTLAHSADYASAHALAATQLALYQNLSAQLLTIWGWSAGKDPLFVIGASNVTAIHTLMTAQWATNMHIGYGQGPIISQECGV